MADFAVGWKLWYVPIRRHGEPCEVTVTKIGRKWAELDNHHRLNMETMMVMRGDYHCGDCHASQAEWEAQQERHKIWRVFRDNIDYAPPGDVTTDAIRQAAALLGIAMPQKEEGNG